MKNERKEMMILFAGLIFLIFQLSFISAIPTLGVFKVDTCVELKQTCGNCSYVNITSVLYPNSTPVVINDLMTKDGSSFNYTFCENSALGNYIVNGIGDPEGVPTIFAYNYIITTTGNNNNYVIPLFLALGGFILLIFAFVLKNNYLGFMTGILFIVLGIYTIVYGLGIMSDFYTTAIAYVSLGLGLFIFLASAYSAINETNVNLFKIGREDEDEDF